MNCRKCGEKVNEGKRFCENCGAPVEEAVPPPAAVGPAPAGAATGAGRSIGSTVFIISTVIALVVGLVIGGLAAWLLTRDSDTATAAVVSMKTSQADGGRVDLREVEFQETLETKVGCRATYGTGGRAALLLVFTDKNAKVIHEKAFVLTSSDRVQEKTYKWRMEEYENNPYRLTAYVFSGRESDTVMAERSVSFRVVRGTETGKDEGGKATTEEPSGDAAILKQQIDDICGQAFADAYAMDPSGSDAQLKAISNEALEIAKQMDAASDVATLQGLLKKAQDLKSQVDEIKKQKGLN